MTRAFLDTSAVLALMNPKDEQHGRARGAFDLLASQRAALLTTSLVLVETYAHQRALDVRDGPPVDRTLAVKNRAAAAVHLVVDVGGYFQ